MIKYVLEGGPIIKNVKGFWIDSRIESDNLLLKLGLKVGGIGNEKKGPGIIGITQIKVCRVWDEESQLQE